MDPEVYKGSGVRDKDYLIDLIRRRKNYCLNKAEEEYIRNLRKTRTRDHEHRWETNWYDHPLDEFDSKELVRTSVIQGYKWLQEATHEHNKDDFMEADKFYETRKGIHNDRLKDQIKAEIEYENKVKSVAKMVHMHKEVLSKFKFKFDSYMRIRGHYK